MNQRPTWQFRYDFLNSYERGTFQGRSKRFFAQILTEKEEIVAHLPNTGSLKSVNVQGRQCLFSRSEDPKRKLSCTLEAIQSDDNVWIGVNTQTPNRVIRKMMMEKVLPQWAQFENFKPEYKISKETRFDFALWNQENKKHFVEVKNVTMLEKDGLKSTAYFPDSVTERGQKHLRELIQLKKDGHTCEVVFFIQRSDAQAFLPAAQIDPVYAELYRDSIQAGVVITPLVVDFQPDHLSVDLTPLVSTSQP